MITQALNLNLIPGQVLPRVNVSQYDSGTRTLQLSIFNGTQAFNVTSGISGFIQGTKPDRTGFQYAASVTVDSNVVTADITQQMTAVSGEVTCELVLANGSDRIATVNFIIYVEPAALADDTVISETELPLIEEAAELAQEIEAIADQVAIDAQTASNAAESAEEWASHSPYIGNNGHWFVFDTASSQFVDTNIDATGPQGATGPTGPQGPQGDAATIAIGTVTTLPAGSNATVTNSGTSEEAVFNFGIPKGQDGTGAGDMLKADYDANGNVLNAGGIASYVSGAISGKANTADLGTAAYKDSTNAVTSGSTDLVESGAVYSQIQTLTNKTDDIVNVISANGAKNLLPSATTDTVIAGATFHVNDDGSVSVTTNGSPTSGVANYIWEFNNIIPSIGSGKYILSGCPSGGGDNSYFLNILADDGWDSEGREYGEGVEIDISTSVTQANISIRSGVTISTPIIFKPMLTLASQPNSDYAHYVPYAKTNRELTSLVGQYVFVEEKVFTALKDGTKTYGQLLTEALASADTYVRNNNYYIALKEATFETRMHPDIVEIMPGVYGTQFMGSITEESAIVFYTARGAKTMSGFNPYYKTVRIGSNNAVTYSNYSNTVANTNCSVVGSIYKKMK